MPRNMSFSPLTTRQAQERTKDVTRRCGWWFLKPGDIIQQVEKAMGLKKGEHIVRIHLVRIVSVAPEPLQLLSDIPDYGLEECRREGFPGWSPDQFIDMFCESHHCDPDHIVNRIEFKYL